MKFDSYFKQLLSILFLAGAFFIAGCSSDDNTVAQDLAQVPDDPAPEDPAPEDPPPVTVTAPANLMGLWEGTMTEEGIDYDVAFVFHWPDGATEGRVMGVAFNKATLQPYVLIDAGYTDDPNAKLDLDFLVGNDGSRGTFMQYYLFSKNLIGPSRGWFELDFVGNTLTGGGRLDGEMTIALEYSLQNANDTVLTDVVAAWSDAEAVRGWDQDSEGTTLTAAPDGAFQALATGASICQGDGFITDVDGFNIFILDDDSIGVGTSMIASNCGDRISNPGLPTQDVAPVDGEYNGLAALFENASGNLNFVTILSERGGDVDDKPSMAMYNVFIKN